jgi:hypothetical protein
MERRTFVAGSVATAVAASMPRRLLAEDEKPEKHCRFGVNYTPSRDWWYCWNDWKPDFVARDLDAIAALGADHMRILLIWPFFQPNASWVSPAHLDRLSNLLEQMRARNLDAVVTAFTGQLSGLYFLPPFQNAYKQPSSSFFTDSTMLSAQETYIRALGAVLRSYPNVLAFDLGNELNTCWTAEPVVGDAWMRRTFDLLHQELPSKLIVNGVDHQPWFTSNTFSPRALAAEHLPVIHSYPYWTGALKYGGPFDPPSISLISGMAALVRAYAGNPNKPVWCEEFNTCIPNLSEQDNARWLELAVTAAMENGVAWFTYWDSHDVNPKFQFNPVEYHLGLLTNDNRVKAQGQTFQALAKVYRGKLVETRENIPPPPTDHTMEGTWAWLLDWMAYKPKV